MFMIFGITGLRGFLGFMVSRQFSCSHDANPKKNLSSIWGGLEIPLGAHRNWRLGFRSAEGLGLGFRV